MKMIRKLFSFFWDRSLLIFAIIGTVNMLISMGGSFMLRNFAGWNLYPAMLVMFAATSVFSFYFNRKYSFHSEVPLSQSIIRFTVVVAVCFHLSFWLNNFAVPWMHNNWFPEMNDMAYSALQIIGVQILFSLLNYVGQRLWAFGYEERQSQKKKKEQAKQAK